MTLPQVTITELDGALGVLPPSAGRLIAFTGPCEKGPIATPATFARVTDLTNNFGQGPTIEAAAYYITTTGNPAVISRAATITDGSVGEITTTNASGTPGTAVVTVDLVANKPLDAYEYALYILSDGTVGTAGITYQISYDGGYTRSPVAQLGTLTEIVTPTGVTFAIAAGTMKAGDVHRATATAPAADATTLGPAIDALGTTAIQWEQLAVIGDILGTVFDLVESKIVGLAAAGKYRSWIGGTRVPNSGESESAYLSAMAGAFSGKSTKHGSMCAGACRLTSGVSGRKYRRPVVFPVAGVQGEVTEEIDTADVNLGALTGCSIRDDNGNTIEHDEAVSPGLDDARFITLRSWDGYPGVYITRPRIMSTDGSDFQIIPNRRVLNLAALVLRSYFIRRLNRPIRINPATGFILEADALEIEGAAKQAMRDALMAKPKASGVDFILSRTDNLLATKTLTGTARVIPLAYPEFINVQLGFFNPALFTTAVAA
jgi:hypothetical protein